LFILASGYLPFNDFQSVIELRYMWPCSVKISAELQDLIKRILGPKNISALREALQRRGNDSTSLDF
jgi:hypothetical protein